MSKKSRTTSPFQNTYDTYENTRENARGERLLNEYNTNPLVVLKKESESKSNIVPRIDLIISHLRLSLRILSVLVSISIVALLAHALSVYLRTKDNWVIVEETYEQRRVWPPWLRTRPTFALLGVAATATLFSLALLLAMCSRAMRSITVMANLFTSFVCLGCVLLWTAIGLYHIFGDLNRHTHTNLSSYVCANELHPLVVKEIGNVRIMCGELRYAWWAVLVVATIEVSVVATVGWAVLAGREKGAYVRVG